MHSQFIGEHVGRRLIFRCRYSLHFFQIKLPKVIQNFVSFEKQSKIGIAIMKLEAVASYLVFGEIWAVTINILQIHFAWPNHVLLLSFKLILHIRIFSSLLITIANRTIMLNTLDMQFEKFVDTFQHSGYVHNIS